MTEQTDRALKEWAVVVRALERGDTVLVLRKGGIVEEGGAFRLQESEFLLFPNYTHQNPTQLQLGYHPLLAETLAERREPDEVTFTSAAEVADAFVVADEEAVARLDGLHVWTRDYLLERLAYKTEQPLWAVVLRVYRLPTPIVRPYLAEYRGCTSWVTLDAPVELSAAAPALDDDAFAEGVERVKRAVEG